MNNYLEHPEEDVLERFLLQQSGEEELEVVETHILACDSCVARLESLEVEIAVTKQALREYHMKKTELSQVAAAKQVSWRGWFTMPRLSMAGGLAAIALGIMVVPQFRSSDGQIISLELSPNRGQQLPEAPKAHPLHVVLNTTDLPQGTFVVKVFNAAGRQEWNGTTQVQQERAQVDVPKLTEAGNYQLELFGTGSNSDQELKEYSFSVK